ncbi:unnamed protein product, partial [Mesorhabditis belari]|uniref:Uncharacterized protein n=1 Tax=Mesorhabditis belari TaxID=2138241 RepID=A0AAF3EXH9_9BILA
MTKRKFLSWIACVYDPLDLPSPVFFKYRLMFRELCHTSLKWDEKLPDALALKPQELETRTSSMKIQVPQKVLPKSDDDLELQVFVDASKVGFGMNAYLKPQDAEHTPHLLFAKSKLASEGCRTAPKLEFTAANAGTKMADFIEEHVNKPIKKVIIWSDNQSVLHWIAGQKWETLGKYATQKLQTILKYPAEFRYIPIDWNPADVSSRGCRPEELAADVQWWHGSSFLKLKKGQWPQFELPPFENAPCAEMTETVAVSRSEPPYESRVDPASVTSWVELTQRLGKTVKNARDTVGEVMRKGEIEAFREAQKRNPPSSCTCRSLALFKDEACLWRATSRTLNREINGEAEHPLFMSGNDPAARLYAQNIHVRLQCAGGATILAEIRKDVWIPKGGSVVKGVIKGCDVCKRFGVTPFKLPNLPQLPKERLRAMTPFESTGCDLAGPFRT